MSEAPAVLVSQAQAVGIIELARPDKFNCLSLAVHAALEEALDKFESPGSGVRAVLVRAQGKNFCTGADLAEVKAMLGNAEALRAFTGAGHRALRRLAVSDLPVVAACQGLSLAGGIELMLACDVVFAADDARFGDQHAQFGLVPGWGGSQRLPRIIGPRRAMDLMLSARWIDAATALQWGLVNFVVTPDALADAALDYCTKLAARSPAGIATMKRLARQGLGGPLELGLQLEEEVASAALMHEDVSEGVAAFEARRTPAFKP